MNIKKTRDEVEMIRQAELAIKDHEDKIHGKWRKHLERKQNVLLGI